MRQYTATVQRPGDLSLSLSLVVVTALTFLARRGFVSPERWARHSRLLTGRLLLALATQPIPPLNAPDRIAQPQL
jgi:hypothetical protein